MHFALPPRKTSHPPPYARTSRGSSTRRRKQFELGGYVVLGLLTLYLVFHYGFRASTGSGEDGEAAVYSPLGTPQVVIVTVLDEKKMSAEYIQRIRENREDYARRHGYANFFTNTTLYAPLYTVSPSSWSLIPALRHAMTLHPHTPWFFALSAHALITTPSLSITTHITEPDQLESLMLKDIPVVPPDSVIKTFSHVKADKVDMVITQDAENLASGSFLMRNGEWARFALDAWFDPLYRGYNFQKAEGHALEHIVQWHPTILAKLVLVPQRTLNSYNFEIGGENPEMRRKSQDGLWKEGDLLVRFAGCESAKERDCEKEMDVFWEKWKKEVRKLDGHDVLKKQEGDGT